MQRLLVTMCSSVHVHVCVYVRVCSVVCISLGDIQFKRSSFSNHIEQLIYNCSCCLATKVTLVYVHMALCECLCVCVCVSVCL